MQNNHVSSTSQASRELMWVVGIALLVRLAMLALSLAATRDPSVFHWPDTSTYVQPATEWLASGRFGVNGVPEIVRTPGYPALLMLGILFGRIELITIALQILISCATVYGVARTGLLIFGRPEPAVLGALLYALEPLSIVYSLFLLSETLSTGLVVFFLYFVFRYLRDERTHNVLIAAIGLAAAAYVRPINYYLLVLMTVLLVMWAMSRRPAVKWRLLQVGAFMMTSFVLVGIWQARNKAVSGYDGFSAIGGLNAYFYQAAAVLAEQQGRSYVEVQNGLGYQHFQPYQNSAVYDRVHPEQQAWSAAAKHRYQRVEGLRVIASAPFVYARIHVQGMIRTLFEPGALEYLRLFKLYRPLPSGSLLNTMMDQGLLNTLSVVFRERPLVFWSMLVLTVLLLNYYALALIACLSLDFPWNMPMLILITTGTSLALMSGGPHSVGRFRHAIMPVVCVLAGYGLWRLIDRFKRVWQTRYD